MTTITRRGLYERVVSLFGRRIAYGSTTAVNEQLGQLHHHRRAGDHRPLNPVPAAAT
ncbi:hypothetical protein AB0M05_35035 [Streptomyces violaceusniger]|uniref:hypothetical protein n=1 Tax=Streptomyces violaceusniger TaxID=68280 RepID=UPI00343B1109